MRTSLAVFCVIVPIVGWAQSTGIKVGATVPYWKYVADSAGQVSPSTLANFTIAFVQEFRLGGAFSLQLEPTYSVRSTQTNIARAMLAQYSPDSLPSSVPENLQFEQEITSVEMPILLRITFDPGIWLRPYILAGPNVRIQLSAVSRLRTDTTGMGSTVPLDVEPNARTAVVSADIGAGVEIPLGVLSIVADVRYMVLLSDMSSLEAFGRRLGTLNSNDLRLFAGFAFRW